MVPVLLPKSRAVELVWVDTHQGGNAAEMERVLWGYLGRTSGRRNGEARRDLCSLSNVISGVGDTDICGSRTNWK